MTFALGFLGESMSKSTQKAQGNPYSLLLERRLASSKLAHGGSMVSDMQRFMFQSLQTLDVDVENPVGGRPNVRGQPGCVRRFRDRWREVIRNHGAG